MNEFILAIDQGTSSSRAMIVDALGAIVAVAQAPIGVSYPHAGWVNQDADEILSVTMRVACEAIARAAIAPRSIAAIGITNQRETTILWERATGKAVAPAIVWQSRQSAGIIDRVVSEGASEAIVNLTGLTPDAYFSASKIAWLLESDPTLRTRAESGELAFGTVDSWLIWRLTGGKRHLTDATNAARTMLFDIRRNVWSDELLNLFNIPAAILPGVVDSIGASIEIDTSVLGISAPVTGIAGDQHAALFGQACFAPGEAKNTYGTGSFMLMNTGAKPTASRNKLLSTLAWRDRGITTYALEGAVFVTGSAVQWLRDGLGIIEEAADIEALASSVEDSGGVVFVPALTGLGAPDWDPGARGAIVGLTRGTTTAHLARAALEGIACQTRDVLDAMGEDSGIPVKELRVDGGASRNDLLMQIQADLLGVPVVRPEITETTAAGVAYMAGVGAGVWDSERRIRSMWREERRFVPAMDEKRRAFIRDRWREAVSRSRDWSRWEA
jgi:glycerol kinase